MPAKGTPYSPEEDRIIRRFGATKTAAEIGLMLERSPISIRSRAQKMGVSMLKYGEAHWNQRLPSLQCDAIKALTDAGFTCPEIKHLLHIGITSQTIYRIGHDQRRIQA